MNREIDSCLVFLLEFFLLSGAPIQNSRLVQPSALVVDWSPVKLRVFGHIFQSCVNFDSHGIFVIHIRISFDDINDTPKRYYDNQNKDMNQMPAEILSNSVAAFFGLLIAFANNQEGTLIVIVKHVQIIFFFLIFFLSRLIDIIRIFFLYFYWGHIYYLFKNYWLKF